MILRYILWYLRILPKPIKKNKGSTKRKHVNNLNCLCGLHLCLQVTFLGEHYIYIHIYVYIYTPLTPYLRVNIYLGAPRYMHSFIGECMLSDPLVLFRMLHGTLNCSQGSGLQVTNWPNHSPHGTITWPVTVLTWGALLLYSAWGTSTTSGGP